MGSKIKRISFGVVSLAMFPAASAMAQSSVTLYGNIDTSMAYYRTGNENTVRMNSGSLWGSRLGMRGSEDIGDGYQIIFKLEQSIDSNNGQAGNPAEAFGREAWVGLSGDFGKVEIGEIQTPTYVPTAGYYDAFALVTMASGFNNFQLESVRQNNAIMYSSPSFHGVTGQVMVGLRDTTMTPTSGLNNYDFALEYNQGPWKLATSYQSVENSTDSSTLNTFFGGGSYGFGRWRAYVGYNHATQTNGTVNNNVFGASLLYNLTANTSLAAGYAWVHSAGFTAPGTADEFSAQVRTFLSKRTEIYASLAKLRNRGKTAFTLNGATVAGVPAAHPGADVGGAEIGILHYF